MNIKKLRFRAFNLQRGIEFVHYSDFISKVKAYEAKYAMVDTIPVHTNIKIRKDLSLNSLCRDRAVEALLHSGRYHINRIGILVNPFVYAPTTAVLLFCSKEPLRVDIRVESGDGKRSYTDSAALAKSHRISIASLTEGRNKVELVLYNENGQRVKKRRFFIWLDELPVSDSPIVKTEVTGNGASEQIFITGGEVNPVVFNTDGSVFHTLNFKKFRTTTYGVYPIADGSFLWAVRNMGVPTFANPHSCLSYEMDFMGRIKRTYHVKNGMHHYVCQMPNGNFVTVSNSIEGHTEDTLIELDRETGKVIRKIYFKDILGDKFVDQIDWVHANALEYNEKEDSMLICFRNVHAVIKINWTTLELQWILSYPPLWEDTPLKEKLLTPIGDVEYFFQAHAAYELKEYSEHEEGIRYYLLFDNHGLNRRPVEGIEAEPEFSYINVYGVNEKMRTVKQVKRLQIDKSIVRSNAYYDSRTNHMFNMSGCLDRKFVEYRGKIEEYDWSDGSLMNRWYVVNDFFSAYPFRWHSDDYCKPCGLDEHYRYVCGEADHFVRSAPKGLETEEPVDTVRFSKPYIEGEYFYFHTKDHTISALILVGEKYCYEKDYSDTWQTNWIHENRTYFCVLTLEGLLPDTYRVKVLVEDKLYDTSYYIEIGEKKDE